MGLLRLPELQGIAHDPCDAARPVHGDDNTWACITRPVGGDGGWFGLRHPRNSRVSWSMYGLLHIAATGCHKSPGAMANDTRRQPDDTWQMCPDDTMRCRQGQHGGKGSKGGKGDYEKGGKGDKED